MDEDIPGTGEVGRDRDFNEHVILFRRSPELAVDSLRSQFSLSISGVAFRNFSSRNFETTRVFDFLPRKSDVEVARARQLGRRGQVLRSLFQLCALLLAQRRALFPLQLLAQAHLRAALAAHRRQFVRLHRVRQSPLISLSIAIATTAPASKCKPAQANLTDLPAASVVLNSSASADSAVSLGNSSTVQ